MSQQKSSTGKNEDKKRIPSRKNQLRELLDKKNALETEIARLESFTEPSKIKKAGMPGQQLFPVDDLQQEALGLISQCQLELSTVTKQISAITAQIRQLYYEIPRVLVAHRELGGFSARKENMLVSEQLFPREQAKEVVQSIIFDLGPIASVMRDYEIFISAQKSSRAMGDRNHTIVFESRGISRDSILEEIQRQRRTMPQHTTSSSSSSSSSFISNSSIPVASPSGFFQAPIVHNTDKKLPPIPEDLQERSLKEVANALHVNSNAWGNFMVPGNNRFLLISDKTCSLTESEKIADNILKVFGKNILGKGHPIIKDIFTSGEQGKCYVHLETRVDAGKITDEVLKIMLAADEAESGPCQERQQMG